MASSSASSDHGPSSLVGRGLYSEGKAEEHLDGKYLLGPADPKLSAEDSAVSCTSSSSKSSAAGGMKQVIEPRSVPTGARTGSALEGALEGYGIVALDGEHRGWIE